MSLLRDALAYPEVVVGVSIWGLCASFLLGGLLMAGWQAGRRAWRRWSVGRMLLEVERERRVQVIGEGAARRERA